MSEVDPPTPYDNPTTLLDRLLFPMMRGAYQRGCADAAEEIGFELDMRLLTGANPLAGEVKQLAIDLVKAGATGKDAEALMRRHLSGPIMSYYELDKLRRYVEGIIQNLMRREGMTDD
jgi:hypothetical protein